MNYWDTIYRVTTGIVVILLTIVLICAFIPKVQRYQESYIKRAEHLEENQHLAQDLKKIHEKIDRFSSEPAYVERTAREAGMVKPDEIIFKYTNEEAKVEKQIP